MGTDFYIVNPKRRALFELGKSGWDWCRAGKGREGIEGVTDFDLIALLEPERLAERLCAHYDKNRFHVYDPVIEAVSYSSTSREMNDEEHREYMNEIARRLVLFVGNCPVEELRIVADCDGCYADLCETHSVTNGRFRGEQPERRYSDLR